MREDAKARYERQVALAQAALEVDPTDTSRVGRARRALQAGVPDMLAPAPQTKPHHSRRRRATTSAIVLGLVVGSAALGATGMVMATKTDLLSLAGIGGSKPTSEPSPAPSPTPVVVMAPNLAIGDLPRVPPIDVNVKTIVNQVITDLAAQRAQEAADAAAAQAAAEAAAAAQQPSSGSTGGSPSSGGSTGGSPGGGTAPQPPAAAYVSGMSFYASSGTGTISITANVQTSGSMSVSVTCTANGAGITLSGPGTVNGSASYSGSYSGLAPGTYTVKCSVPGQLSASPSTFEVY